MIPFSFGAALASVVSGLVVSRTGQYLHLIWFSFVLFTIGYGLTTMLDAYSSRFVHRNLFYFRISVRNM